MYKNTQLECLFCEVILIINQFGLVLDEIHNIAKDEAQKCNSQIVQGTVLSIDPLEIELENGEILPSKRFELSDFCIAKMVKFRVHQAYGNPQEIKFNFDGAVLEKTLKALLYNITGSGRQGQFNVQTSIPHSGSFSSSTAIPPQGVGVSGQGFTHNITIDKPPDTEEYNLSINMGGDVNSKILLNTLIDKIVLAGAFLEDDKEDMRFRVEFIEKPEHEFVLDEPENHPHQDQTVVIEGVIWRGLRPGDIVKATSHNEKQLYFVHRILNREREQYEHGIAWDSRLIDGRATDGVTLGFDTNIPRH